MYYECDINGTPVSCQLIQWDAVSGKCLIEYTDPIGLLRLWVDGDRIKGRAVPHEISL